MFIIIIYMIFQDPEASTAVGGHGQRPVVHL